MDVGSVYRCPDGRTRKSSYGCQYWQSVDMLRSTGIHLQFTESELEQQISSPIFVKGLCAVSRIQEAADTTWRLVLPAAAVVILLFWAFVESPLANPVKELLLQ